MSSLIGVLYGVYFVLVGLRGNAPEFITAIEGEGQFIYWLVILLVLSGLWQVDTGEEFTKPFIVLLIVGFLLHNGNGMTMIANAKQVIPQATGA